MAYRSIKVSHNNDLNMKTIEQKIKKARFEKKIFILLGSYYKVIRSSLLSRGWLEKIIDNQMPYALPGSERFIIASLLKHYPAQFIWQAKYRPIKRDENRPPFMNSIRRQRRFNFTSKDGLKNCFDAIGWNHEDGVVELSYNPRTHILDDKTTRDEFFEDFRNTAFTSFIYFLNTQEDLSELFSAAGTLTTDCIQYTVSKIELMIRIKEHVDIDMSKLFDTCAKYPQNQKIILHHIKQIIKGIKKFRFTSIENIERLKNEIKECAEKIEEQWPHLKYDGYSNIWILKPLHASQGNGIILEADDDKIRQLLANSSRTYLAQKYVERPLLIYNRKFDLRVYILTTILNRTVNIWLYRNCYIKFATKNFNLEDYHRSIHLTNYSVQKYFMKPENAVPKSVQGMWSLKQLKQYFESIGKNDMWDLKIYPGIKKSILAVMLPSLESTNIEHKTFELNGADVLITFDYEPSVLEINSSPALFLCRAQMEMITNQLLEDVVKVVVDHSTNKSAFTGDFELIYSQEVPEINLNTNINITVNGSKIEKTIKRVPYKKNIEKEVQPQIVEVIKNAATGLVYLRES